MRPQDDRLKVANMKWHSCVSPIFATAALLFGAKAVGARPQAADSPEAGVALTRLFPPVYPPLARQARITGDVVVKLQIRADGSVESAQIVSGHPMLKQAALESAEKSMFECRECDHAGTTYLLTYKFQIGDDCPRYGPNCEAVELPPPEIHQSGRTITLRVEPLCTYDPAVEIIRFRSAKCLYLWKCGHRQIALQ